jgi:hypothetical protein
MRLKVYAHMGTSKYGRNHLGRKRKERRGRSMQVQGISFVSPSDEEARMKE